MAENKFRDLENLLDGKKTDKKPKNIASCRKNVSFSCFKKE